LSRRSSLPLWGINWEMMVLTDDAYGHQYTQQNATTHTSNTVRHVIWSSWICGGWSRPIACYPYQLRRCFTLYVYHRCQSTAQNKCSDLAKIFSPILTPLANRYHYVISLS
jgi:hypothetical protein